MPMSDEGARPRLSMPARPTLLELGPPAMAYTPPPQVSVEATYAASDGTIPETITVRWDLMGGAPTNGAIAAAVDALAEVPRRRYESLPCSHEQ